MYMTKTRKNRTHKKGGVNFGIRNTLKSVGRIATSGNYVRALASASLGFAEVERILFKNAYFINFIKEEDIKGLYCSKKGIQDCVKIEDGYIYTNDPTIAKAADTLPIGQSPSVPIGQPIRGTVFGQKTAADIADYVHKGLIRLNFVKLNNAIVTDGPSHVQPTENPKFINFKHESIFKFFTTYKYQVDRALQYGGWNEWYVMITELQRAILLQNQTPLSVHFNEMVKIKMSKIVAKLGGNMSKPFQFLLSKAFSGLDSKTILNEINRKASVETAKNETVVKNNQEEKQAVVDDSRPSNGGGISSAVSAVGSAVYNRGSAIGSKIVNKSLNMILSPATRIRRTLGLYFELPSYTHVMNREAIITLEFAISLFRSRDTSTEEFTMDIIQTRYQEIVQTIRAKTNSIPMAQLETTLDAKIEELASVYNQQKANRPSLSSRITGRRGGKRNKTRKIKGGKIPFISEFKRIAFVCFQQTVRTQLEDIINDTAIPDENARYRNAADFFSQLILITLNIGGVTCMSLVSQAVGYFDVVGSPICIISNLMALVIVVIFANIRDLAKQMKKEDQTMAADINKQYESNYSIADQIAKANGAAPTVQATQLTGQ